MSTTSNLPTRQQLEEIDALLKRMLSLPPLAAESRDDPAAVTPVPPAPDGEARIQSWRVEWPAQPAAAPPAATVAAWGSPVTPAAPAAAPRLNVYAPPVTPPPAQAPYVSPPFSPAYPPGYEPRAYPQTPVPVAVTPQPAAKVAAPERRSPVLFPVVALNGVYDVLTYLLPMGSWWRTGGRTWLGRAGVLMLLAAGGWAAGEWQGVEWPKPDVSKIDVSRFGWAK